MLWNLVSHQRIGNTEKLQISKQCFCPGIADIIGYQQPFSLKFGSQFGCFASRSST